MCAQRIYLAWSAHFSKNRPPTKIATLTSFLLATCIRRYKGIGGVHEAWECEAISQRILVDTLRTRLEALLPEPLDRVHGRELRQRRKVAAMLRGETLW